MNNHARYAIVDLQYNAAIMTYCDTWGRRQWEMYSMMINLKKIESIRVCQNK